MSKLLGLQHSQCKRTRRYPSNEWRQLTNETRTESNEPLCFIMFSCSPTALCGHLTRTPLLLLSLEHKRTQPRTSTHKHTRALHLHKSQPHSQTSALGLFRLLCWGITICSVPMNPKWTFPLVKAVVVAAVVGVRTCLSRQQTVAAVVHLLFSAYRFQLFCVAWNRRSLLRGFTNNRFY